MSMVRTAARYRWVILALAFGAQLSNALASLAIAPLAPLFQPELGLTKAEVGLFSSAVYAGSWGVLLVAGSLADRVGVRWVMALGQLLTGTLLLSMSLVNSFLQAAALMFAAGVGRGAAAPGMAKAVTDWFPPNSRATAMGLKQTGFPLAGMVTASTLPALGLAIGWRSAIAVVGFVVLACGISTANLYRDPPGSDSPTPSRTLPSGLHQVLRNRRLWALSLMAILLLFVQLGLATYLALYLVDVVLVTLVPDYPSRVIAAGGLLALCQAGGICGRVFWGAISDRVFRGRRVVVLAIIAGLCVLLSLVMSYLESGVPPLLLAGAVFAYGASAIGWNGLHDTVVTETVDRRHAATGVGLGMTLSQVGTVGGPPLFGFVVDVSGSYRTAWLLLALLSAAAALVAIPMAKDESASRGSSVRRPASSLAR